MLIARRWFYRRTKNEKQNTKVIVDRIICYFIVNLFRNLKSQTKIV